jgi:hypothetical protein
LWCNATFIFLWFNVTFIFMWFNTTFIFLWFNVTYIFFLATLCPGYLGIACKSGNGDMRTDFQFLFFLMSFRFCVVQWAKVFSLTFFHAVFCFRFLDRFFQ